VERRARSISEGSMKGLEAVGNCQERQVWGWMRDWLKRS